MKSATFGFYCLMMLLSGFPHCSGAPMCTNVVGVLRTEFVFEIPISKVARVEIRQCSSDGREALQLVAWPGTGSTNPLIIDTFDFGVVQEFARKNVFVVETGGATRDQVFVLVFESGTPHLALRQVTKGTAKIIVDDLSVDLRIAKMRAGTEARSVETYHFPLGAE